MEAISSWGPWMDFVSIYIIPIGAVIGAISWFWIIKGNEILDEINLGAEEVRGKLWYDIGRFVYVPLALLLCIIALSMHISF
jgi:transporter